MRFSDLPLSDRLLAVLADEGYEAPTAIQQKAIPHVLQKRDLIGLAQTGTGKTAAFALPIIQLLSEQPIPQPRNIRVLVLAPTRELAAQIGQSFETYGRGSGLKQTVIFGGVGQDKQVRALRAGVDVLVATPGRLLDLASQGVLNVDHLEYFVIDEADRMLDMGFVHDVRRVVKLLPKERQTLFFSATMPPEVRKLSDGLLRNPAQVEAHPVSSTAERVQQSVYFVQKNQKRFLLHHLVSDPAVQRALVFTRTKHLANRVAEFLTKSGVEAMAIHGNKSQSARERALSSFISGSIRVLVATDIAARGIDVDGVTHVFNYDLPNVPESYVHRIGRTARAGASGVAVAFCDNEERPLLRDIERLIRQEVPRAGDHPFKGEASPLERPPPQRGQRPSGPSRQPRSGAGSRSGSGARSSSGSRSSSDSRKTSGARSPQSEKAEHDSRGGRQGSSRRGAGSGSDSKTDSTSRQPSTSTSRQASPSRPGSQSAAPKPSGGRSGSGSGDPSSSGRRRRPRRQGGRPSGDGARGPVQPR